MGDGRSAEDSQHQWQDKILKTTILDWANVMYAFLSQFWL